jgi:hypothetical protein
MSAFLSVVCVLTLGVCFIWYNERKERRELESHKAEKAQGDTVILRDAVIRFADGTVMHIYEAKPSQPNMVCHTFAVGPNAAAVLETNMEEIQEIEKYHAHLLECGLHLSLEEAAMAWAMIKARAWREENFTGVLLEDIG